MKQNKKQTQIRIDVELYAKLKKLAYKHEMPVTHFVDMKLRDVVESLS